jgi:hypothetical protein
MFCCHKNEIFEIEKLIWENFQWIYETSTLVPTQLENVKSVGY